MAVCLLKVNIQETGLMERNQIRSRKFRGLMGFFRVCINYDDVFVLTFSYVCIHNVSWSSSFLVALLSSAYSHWSSSYLPLKLSCFWFCFYWPHGLEEKGDIVKQQTGRLWTEWVFLGGDFFSFDPQALYPYSPGHKGAWPLKLCPVVFTQTSSESQRPRRGVVE